MKYIRTKDGRIVDISIPSRIRTKILKTHNTQWILEHNADTIEELVDGFWWEDDFYKAPIFISNYQFVLDRVQNWVESDKKLSTTEFARINIYASVYVKGKGWLYVAKMKGVLPNGEIDWELL